MIIFVSWNKSFAFNTIWHRTPSGSKNITNILRTILLVTCNLFVASTMLANSKTKQSVLVSQLIPSTLQYFELIPNEFCTYVSSSGLTTRRSLNCHSFPICEGVNLHQLNIFWIFHKILNTVRYH